MFFDAYVASRAMGSFIIVDPGTNETLAAGLLCLLGAASHLYLPLASMTNPPSDWGYPREVGGFFHSLTRGQFEHIHPTESLGRLVEQVWTYGDVAARKYGLIYLLVAVVPFWFLRRMHAHARGLLLGLLAFYLCLSVLMLFLLNPPPARQVWELVELFFPPSYLVLALSTGYGLYAAVGIGAFIFGVGIMWLLLRHKRIVAVAGCEASMNKQVVELSQCLENPGYGLG